MSVPGASHFRGHLFAVVKSTAGLDVSVAEIETFFALAQRLIDSVQFEA